MRGHFRYRRPRSTRSWMSSSRRVLGTHASEGGGTSPALPDVEKEDLGESLAISGGCEWIESTTRWRRKMTRAKGSKKQEGKKAGSGKLGSE